MENLTGDNLNIMAVVTACTIRFNIRQDRQCTYKPNIEAL